MGWLSSAEKLGSNFAEITDSFYFAFFAEVAQRRGACWRRLGRAPGNRHPEQKGQCANTAGCLLHGNKKLLIPRGIRRGQPCPTELRVLLASSGSRVSFR